MLNPNDASPLYKQLEDELRKRIACGEFMPRDRLPSENELAREYGVSLITARKAIAKMVETGTVEKKQGKGTFVCAPIFRRNFSQVLSFSEACKLNGTVASTKLLERKLVAPDRDTLEKLERPTEQNLVYISRLRMVDGEPMAIETNIFPSAYAFFFEEDLENNSLFELLRKRNGVHIGYSRREFQICRATHQEAHLLNLKKGMPLLLVKSVAYSTEYKPVFVGSQLISGERYRFTI